MKKLKISTIISFLIIVFPGKIAIANFIILPLILLNFFFMLGIDSINFSLLKEPLISSVTILSVFFIFNKKKYLVFLSVFVQYFYLFYIFNFKYINYWYFTIPTAIYLVLSLILIYFLFFKSKERIK